MVDAPTADWLSRYRFTGDIDGYAEGELLPQNPILTVSGTFAECVLLETLVLSVLNHDCAVAAAVARMVTAARGRTLIEMGSRRTHEEAAVAAARAAYLAGFSSTSNLAAGRRNGIPRPHRGPRVHPAARQETAAFNFPGGRVLQRQTTLLVDTYDIAEGIRRAVAVAGPQLGATNGLRRRGGPGPPISELLDSLGAVDTRIIVSGDLDELSIEALAASR